VRLCLPSPPLPLRRLTNRAVLCPDVVVDDVGEQLGRQLALHENEAVFDGAVKAFDHPQLSMIPCLVVEVSNLLLLQVLSRWTHEEPRTIILTGRLSRWIEWCGRHNYWGLVY
jgi:hypothetical protein